MCLTIDGTTPVPPAADDLGSKATGGVGSSPATKGAESDLSREVEAEVEEAVGVMKGESELSRDGFERKRKKVNN